jgi:hypothetical protein
MLTPESLPDLPPEVAAQVAEATETVEQPAKLKTKTIMWHGRAWQIRHTAGAVFLDRYEHGKAMGAAEAILSDQDYAALLEMDPDIDGDGDSMEGFFDACNKAWGVKQGN